jgi:hypothetical protein
MKEDAEASEQFEIPWARAMILTPLGVWPAHSLAA